MRRRHELEPIDLRLVQGRAMCSCGVLSGCCITDRDRLQWHRRHLDLMIVAELEDERRHPPNRFNHFSGVRPIIDVYLPGDAPGRQG